MGYTADTLCLECGYEFTDDYGGGFTFYQVRCDRCGKAKQVRFDRLGDLLYLDLMSEEFHQGVSEIAGRHRCGGQYTLEAKPRCPECGSVKLDVADVPTCNYD